MVLTADLALVLGTTVRLTRFVTTDDLGQWLVGNPLRTWANAAEGNPARLAPGWWTDAAGTAHPLTDDPDPDNGPRSKAVSGLTCPHCAGYWIGTLTLASYWLARRNRRTLAAWRATASTFTLSAVVGHLNARID